jgi:hypothetical protein
MSPVNYRLELPTQWKIHDVFHTDLLTPYREMVTHGTNYQRPPPDLVDGVEEYKVERVLDSRQYGRGHKLQYLVKWVGYPDLDNQWVNWDDAMGTEDAIREFKRTNSNREVHIKASCTHNYSSSNTLPSLMSTSSYHDAAICYANNNNVNDAATYNDHLRGHRSPGLNSDILNTSTTTHDLEKPETHVPAPTPRTSDTDATSRPPILEDSRRCLGGRLPVQGVCMPGEEEGVVGKSAGNTPYPSAAILFGDSDGEDNDVQCGQCENPLDYCHCDNTDILIIPPPIITAISTTVTTTQDGKETALPTAEEEEDDSPSVEVRVGRRLHSPADTQGGVQEHRSRMYTPGTPQRPTHCTLSPTPDGFIHNKGLNYVPFRIPTTNGRGAALAKFVMVRMGVNPTVTGCMYRGGAVYQGEVHTAASHDHGSHVPDYAHEQLRHFCSNYTQRHEVDDALEHIGNKLLLAEVSQFRGTMDAMKRLQDEICDKENELYCYGSDNRKCVRHLEQAHALGRVFKEEEIANRLWVITLWALERQRQLAEEW